MRNYIALFHLALLAGLLSCSKSSSVSLFNGENLEGWEGNTLNVWRAENGLLQAGSLTEMVPHNDFLCTTQPYGNFILKLKFKLEGDEGFVNSGVQFRSIRDTDPAYEMIGYQADIGADFFGALYDESRRDSVLTGPDSLTMVQIVKIGEWNDYEIRAEGAHIQLTINGHQTVDYVELDPNIPREGLIGLQIHGGGKTLVSFKDIWIEEL